jgi:hypothetical protein
MSSNERFALASEFQRKRVHYFLRRFRLHKGSVLVPRQVIQLHIWEPLQTKTHNSKPDARSQLVTIVLLLLLQLHMEHAVDIAGILRAL